MVRHNSKFGGLVSENKHFVISSITHNNIFMVLPCMTGSDNLTHIYENLTDFKKVKL